MKNTLKRIAALLLAVMMLSMLALSASAATTFDGTNNTVAFTLDLTKETNVYAPYTTYTFEIKAGTAVAGAAGQDTIYAGALDEVAFVADTEKQQALGASSDDVLVITSTPDAADVGVDKLTDNGKIQIDPTKYEDPGIYRYIVTQTAGTYAGVTYDSTPRTLDVYIAEEGTGMKVIAAVLYYNKEVTEGEVTKTIQVKDGIFTNAYDTADLTVTKEVTGNLGDTNKEFDITVKITGVKGEQYYIVNGEDKKTVIAGEDGTVSATYALAHNESFTVYGLSAGDSYVVTEADYSADGYTTTIQNNGEGTIAAAEEVANAFITVTNEKNVTIPTGIALTILPFVAMFLLAILAAVIFFQKRERREV